MKHVMEWKKPPKMNKMPIVVLTALLLGALHAAESPSVPHSPDASVGRLRSE